MIGLRREQAHPRREHPTRAQRNRAGVGRPTRAGELGEHFDQVCLDVLAQRENAVVLRDYDPSQLACPLVDVAEDPAVKCPELREVVPARQPRELELGDQDRRLLGLDPRELARVTDAETVPQAARARVDVWVGWQRG